MGKVIRKGMLHSLQSKHTFKSTGFKISRSYNLKHLHMWLIVCTDKTYGDFPNQYFSRTGWPTTRLIGKSPPRGCEKAKYLIPLHPEKVLQKMDAN